MLVFWRLMHDFDDCIEKMLTFAFGLYKVKKMKNIKKVAMILQKKQNTWIIAIHLELGMLMIWKLI